MVYAANCCRLNYENFTIIIFIILTQCGLLRMVISAPMYKSDSHIRDKALIEVKKSTSFLQNNELNSSMGGKSSDNNNSKNNSNNNINSTINNKSNNKSIHSNNNKIHKNNAEIKHKNKTYLKSRDENHSIVVDLEISFKKDLFKFLTDHTKYLLGKFGFMNSNISTKTVHKSTNKPQPIAVTTISTTSQIAAHNDKDTHSFDLNGHNSSSVNENVNRIIQNDLVNVQDYESNDLANDYSKFYNEISKLKFKSNEISVQNDDEFDIINNSIENDDFYFAYSTTDLPEVNDEIERKNDSDPISTSLETTPPPTTTTIITTTPITFLKSSSTTASIIGLNQTIPYNIPFQFNNSQVDIYDVVEFSTNGTKSPEIRLEIEKTSSKATELSSDNLDNFENTIISIDLILDNLYTIITPPSTTPLVTTLSTPTTSEIIITDIKPEIETSENQISSTTSTIDVINILTTTSLPVDLNTTKSIPYPDNPIFLDCISSCGTDHDCVRTKCLLDSTYFG